ncbi:hypothetical protein Cch01nite_15870 [Cellulomonas chitinilytica]|uniref:DUF2510 domain-containing protein n=1 Tax=Cellulomonas chitinilytica TaxID=398759 RepID=A0A919P2U3_9CELL|nr:DUF2510 domain-containing protein [Cellulomonas chitinilytica]GIG20863.1 hypothetical protein Cch01nite_15870 [Cellulomonas chitinilytica]
MDGETGVPAGWYDDGTTPGVRRWYDGSTWTEHVRPVDGPVATPAAPARHVGQVAPQPTGPVAAASQGWSPGTLDPSLDLPPVTHDAAVPAWAGAQHTPVESTIRTYGGPGAPVGRPGGGVSPGAAAPGAPVGFGTPVGFGSTSGFGTPVGFGSPAGIGGLGDAGHHRSWSIGQFWAGLGVLTLGGVTGLLAGGSHGGVVWTGGLVTGTVLLVRAGLSFRSARAAGAPAPSGPGMVVAALGTLVAVVVGVSGLLHSTSGLGVGPFRGLPGPVAGSCWRTVSEAASRADVSEVVEVRCSGVHDFTARLATPDPAACQLLTETLLDLDDGTYLCLVPTSTGGSPT